MLSKDLGIGIAEGKMFFAPSCGSVCTNTVSLMHTIGHPNLNRRVDHLEDHQHMVLRRAPQQMAHTTRHTTHLFGGCSERK